MEEIHMNNELTLFEQLTLWLCRNRHTYTIGREFYKHRVYIQGAYTFMELTDTEVAIMGTSFYYKATTLEELIKFVNGIGY
jgi:hypothetical protein